MVTVVIKFLIMGDRCANFVIKIAKINFCKLIELFVDVANVMKLVALMMLYLINMLLIKGNKMINNKIK